MNNLNQSGNQPKKLDDNTFIINLFFDGTGNNGYNATINIHDKDTKEKSESYNSSYTNIYRLYNNACGKYNVDVKRNVKDNPYPEEVPNNCQNFYITGIGTETDQKDQKIIQALGDITILETMFKNLHESQNWFVKQLNRALSHTEIEQLLKSYIQGANAKIENLNKDLSQINKEKIKGKNIEINIFGFSRGATLARCYANLIKNNNFNIIKDPSNPTQSIKINFLGLFDTVESIVYTEIYKKEHKTKFNTNVKDVAEYCYHLTAKHEARHTFPLTSILYPHKTNVKNLTYGPDIKANYFSDQNNHQYLEINLSGAHADIGGGYLTDYNQLQSISDNYYLRSRIKARKATIENDPKWKDIFAESISIHKPKKNIIKKFLLSNRENINGQLQYVYLMMMAKAASSQGCPFNLDRLHYEYAKDLPKELQSYLETLTVINEHAMNGKKIEQDLKNTLDLNQLPKIAKYIHVSFNYDTPYSLESSKAQNKDAKPLQSINPMSKTSDIVFGSTPTDDQIIENPADKNIPFYRVYQPSSTWEREVRYHI